MLKKHRRLDIQLCTRYLHITQNLETQITIPQEGIQVRKSKQEIFLDFEKYV